jgi:radical SAM enzyme (TIGR01210 family)
MCGYNIDSRDGVTSEDIVRQFDHALRELGDVGMLKLYTSGSFLDESEVPMGARDLILGNCAERGIRLLLESRPEFVTNERMADMLRRHEDIEVALGLESANDLILAHSINKGFLRKDYDSAASVLNGNGIPVRTYVLLKPPFLTEAEAIADSISTIEHASKVSETVSLNPVNVQKGTLVERLWKNWSYRPPWLWSVLEVLKAASGKPKRLVCEPTGGGKERGAHNCGRCDDTILSSIKAFSESQDSSRLGWTDCSCREALTSAKVIEGYAMGGTCDLQRLARRARA